MCLPGSDPKPFLTEFLHPDRKFRDANVVLISEDDPDAGTMELLKDPRFAPRVESLKGNLQVRAFSLGL